MYIFLVADIRDIRGPIFFKGNYFLFLATLLLILLSCLGILIYYLVKKRKKIGTEPALPPKTAYEVAREALDKLKNRNLPGKDRVKEYYSEISDIIRRYVESRFRIKAPEMTTEEFLHSLKGFGVLSGMHRNTLKEFLTLCDIVKFARYGPNNKEIDGSFRLAEKFVDETKPVPSEEPQPAV